MTWKNVIHAHKSLWYLKSSTEEGKQQLYQYLMLVKGWRNSESHISPTASEQEVDAAIRIIITMYFYATGSSITDLEMNGHNLERQAIAMAENDADHTRRIVSMYPPRKTNQEVDAIAADAPISGNLPEEERITILKKSLVKFVGYDPRKSPLGKQRNWIAIYRVAADLGLTIDGDFAYFKRIIDQMQIAHLPTALKTDFLEKSIKGVYARNLMDWSREDFTDRNPTGFKEVKSCADSFWKVTVETMNQRH